MSSFIYLSVDKPNIIVVCEMRGKYSYPFDNNITPIYRFHAVIVQSNR
jgi:hypothetical protein